MADLLAYIILGGLMGMLGQGARAVIGLKGMADNARTLNVNPNDLFEAGRLITSIIIGFLVGLAAALISLKGADVAVPGWQTMLAWVASGYAGTDFLEGFISQYLPQGAATSKSTTGATADVVKPPPAPPPTFSLQTAQGIVQHAFDGMGKPNMPQNSVLTDSPIKFTGWPDYLRLLELINAQLDPTHLLSQATGVGWQVKGTKVSDVVHSVQYAPVHAAPAAAAVS